MPTTRDRIIGGVRRLQGRRVWRGMVAAVGAGLLVATSIGTPARAASSVKRNDYNRDGASDIIAINQGDMCLYRWNGNGAGGFGAGTKVGCGWGPYAGSLVAAGDINRDGVGDLVAINVNDGYLYRWLGNGSGAFGAATRLGPGWINYQGRIFGAGDLNRDGVGDIVAMNKVTGDTIRWYGNGSGSFGSGVRIATQASALWAHRFELTGVGDLNGDGIGDAVAHDPGNRCTLRFLGTSSGTYGNPSSMSSACFATNLSGMGDINGDGRGDMVGYDSSATPTPLRIFTGSSAGYFGPGTVTGTGWQKYDFAR